MILSRLRQSPEYPTLVLWSYGPNVYEREKDSDRYVSWVDEWNPNIVVSQDSGGNHGEVPSHEMAMF